MSPSPVVDVRDLVVAFPGKGERPHLAVDRASLSVAEGEAVGIVGESGSGKTTLAMAMLGLNPPYAQLDGEVVVGGVEMLSGPKKAVRSTRGRVIGLILQDPTPSLNPLRTIGSQVAEACRRTGIGRGDAAARCAEHLASVGLDPDTVMPRYPFELSGGMNQRVAIAMALAQEPSMLVADEPTTALDVTTQAGIIALLDRIRRERGMAMVLISHDFAVVYQMTDTVVVMYAGKIVEVGPTAEVVARPRHPYTRALIGSLPDIGTAPERLRTIPGTLDPSSLPPDGCPFAPRCDVRRPVCDERFPDATELRGGAKTWCWAVQAEDEAAPVQARTGTS